MKQEIEETFLLLVRGMGCSKHKGGTQIVMMTPLLFTLPVYKHGQALRYHLGMLMLGDAMDEVLFRHSAPDAVRA